MNLKDKVFRKLEEQLKTFNTGSDDFIIASYPKAGSTWLRFLLANIYNGKTNTYEEVDFHTIHEIVPDLDQQNDNEEFDELPNIYSTHKRYRSNFQNCILLLRHPLDLFYSYYNYLQGDHGKSLSMEEVIKSKEYGMEKLVAHTASFRKNCDNLLIVTYEDMHAKPKKVLDKLTNFIGVEATEEELEEAISQSSFNSMRNVEDRKGRKFKNTGFKFTRSGKVGEGEANIPEELQQYVWDEIQKSPLLDFVYK